MIKANSPFEIGRDPKEAASLTARADLMILVRDIIKRNDWTQEQAAKVLGTTQPRVSNLNSGCVSKFSLGMLVEFLIKLGYEFDMKQTRHSVKITLVEG